MWTYVAFETSDLERIFPWGACLDCALAREQFQKMCCRKRIPAHKNAADCHGEVGGGICFGTPSAAPRRLQVFGSRLSAT